MSTKLFTFNASSFALDANVENLLRSRGAITLDFGSSAYINSDLMPLILSELVEKLTGSASSELVAQLKAELMHIDSQRQKMTEDGAKVVQQLKFATTEITSLKDQLENAHSTIESLKLSAQLPTKQTTPDFRQTQYENVLKELRQLKAQNAEAITSLKVLEDENEELREELDALKALAKAAPSPKAG